MDFLFRYMTTFFVKGITFESNYFGNFSHSFLPLEVQIYTWQSIPRVFMIVSDNLVQEIMKINTSSIELCSRAYYICRHNFYEFPKK
jgi:hypothetical protein